MTVHILSAQDDFSAFVFDSARMRVFIGHGDPWFVASDVAAALGYLEPHKAVTRHCKRAKSLKELDGTVHPVDQNADLDEKTKLIPESDVYRLISRSKLPAAERFENWLFEDVLPSIRKTGGYAIETTEVQVSLERLSHFMEDFGRFVQLGMSQQAAQITEVRSNVARVETKVDTLAGSVRSLEHTVSQIGPRRRTIAGKVRSVHVQAVHLLGGRCPCCGMAILTDDDGRRMAGEFDHFYASNFPNADHTWLICKSCHDDLTTGVTSRTDAERQFHAYQDRRKRMPGAQMALGMVAA